MEKDLEQQLQLVRSAKRITGKGIIQQVFTNLLELHGDRINADDEALYSAIGMLDGQPVTLLSVDRGQNLTERLAKNGGALRASGYRKALRSIELAEHFNRPIISLINMPGADASVDSENEGQSLMIARVIEVMGQVNVPNLGIVVGEGHSGGALAFLNTNQIWMLENSLFSVAAPEAMAAILRDDTALARVPMRANQLAEIGLIERVFDEDKKLIQNLTSALQTWLLEMKLVPTDQLVLQREQKFQNILNYWQKLEESN